MRGKVEIKRLPVELVDEDGTEGFFAMLSTDGFDLEAVSRMQEGNMERRTCSSS